MLSFAQPQQFYQIFLTQGVGVGISLGFLFLPSVSVISHHFEQKRALAMGIAASGSSCGGIVFPILINKMIEKYGFPWATRIATFVCLGLMSISLACMRTRPPPPRPQVEGSEPPSVLAILKDVPYILAVLAALANVMGIFFLGRSLLLNLEFFC
jgi:MCP family monocarboxylic acid transporter-like MFS transporter 10